MKEIKFKYYYGISGRPETYFHKEFTLSEIEAGEQFEVLYDNPLLREYRILDRVQYCGFKDMNDQDVYENDIIQFTFKYLGQPVVREQVMEWCECEPGDDMDFTSYGFHINPNWIGKFIVVGNTIDSKLPI